jgi:hypothetical protein
MRVSQFHAGGMYTHNAIAGAYLLVKTVLWIEDTMSYEITFDIKMEVDDSIKANNQSMIIHHDDLYKWTQRGVC